MAIRSQFKDIEGCSELAMLAAPSDEELEQLRKAVAIMTPNENVRLNLLLESSQTIRRMSFPRKRESSNKML